MRLTSEVLDSVREDAKTMTTHQLIDKYKVHRDTMYKTLRKNKIKPFRTYPGRTWTKGDYRILKVCAGKVSTSGIAKLLDRTQCAVESKCQDQGMTYGRYGSYGSRK